VRPSLRPGLEHRMVFTVPSSNPVPALYPEAPEFPVIPEVFATGFLIALEA